MEETTKWTGELEANGPDMDRECALTNQDISRILSIERRKAQKKPWIVSCRIRRMVDLSSLPERAVDEFLTNGLYCSEAILQVYNEALELGLSEAALKMATAFGTGLGGSKCLCGSLSGAVLVLSALRGRTSGKEPVDDVFSRAKRLHDEFRRQFNGTCCRVLTRDQDWGTPQHHQHCAQYVRGAATLLNEVLTDSSSSPAPEN